MSAITNKFWVRVALIQQIRPQNKEPLNKYFQEVKPLLLLLRFLGRFPYSFNERGIAPFKILSLPSAYTAVYFIVETVWTTFSFCHISREKILKSKSYDETLYWASIIIFLMINFTVPFTHWVEAHKISEYVISWKHFQEDDMKSELDLRLTRTVRIIAILLLPINFCFMLFMSYLLANLPSAVMIPYVSANSSAMTTITIWWTTLYELRSASNQLLEKITPEGCRNMSAFRRAWLNLSKLVSSVGENHGYSALAMSVILFTSFILTMYAIVSTLFESSVISNNFFGLMVGATVGATCNFIICNSAHLTTQEVGVNFNYKVLKLGLTHLSQNDVNETMLLLQTMATNPPLVEFLGFVTVNRNLFVSFVSNTVTFLVVLVQFKSSPPPIVADNLEARQ